MAILLVIFPTYFVWPLPLNQTNDIAHAASTIGRVTTQIIDLKNLPWLPLEDSGSKEALCGAKIEHLYGLAQGVQYA